MHVIDRRRFVGLSVGAFISWGSAIPGKIRELRYSQLLLRHLISSFLVARLAGVKGAPLLIVRGPAGLTACLATGTAYDAR